MKKEAQKNQILRHMREIGPITPLDALNLYGCYRLSARIKDLRDDGIIIRTRLKTVKTAHGGTANVAEYSYEGEIHGKDKLENR